MIKGCVIGPFAEDILDGQLVLHNFGDSRFPHEVRADLESLEELVEDSVWITTHNPAVVDWFQDRPDDVCIEVDGELRSLTDTFGEDWLSHFRLADLYMRGTLFEEK